MQRIRVISLAGLMALAGMATADVTVEGPIEHGLFVSPQQELQPGERILSRSNQGIEPTSRIPARLGTRFGMRYSLSGKREGDTPLTLLYLTPGVMTPDGQRHDKFEVLQKLVPGAPQDVMAFEFTERHEMVPGDWHFMVFQGDRKLLEQTFQVYAP
ncbi:DUF3859 domain-containing protein [Pseudomonas sp.]|uniref:DUF3859 domain-containing protein n=1 Tax=Pseudomonas sp. TaxID=306 RepID=UPI003D0C3AFF